MGEKHPYMGVEDIMHKRDTKVWVKKKPPPGSFP